MILQDPLILFITSTNINKHQHHCFLRFGDFLHYPGRSSDNGWTWTQPQDRWFLDHADFLMTRFVVWCFVVPSGLRNTAGPTIRLHCMGFMWYLWYLLMPSFWSCFSRYRDVILSVTCEMGRSKISLFGLHVDACAESWWEWSIWNGWEENWENGKHGTPPQNFGRTLKLEQSQNHPICCLKGRIHDSYPLLHGIHALGWRFTRFQICDAKLLRWVEIRKSTQGERWEGRHSCSGEASRHLEISTSDGSSTCLISDCFLLRLPLEAWIGVHPSRWDQTRNNFGTIAKIAKNQVFFCLKFRSYRMWIFFQRCPGE